ncbi:MAG: methyltransferase domain-containing protein [Propionivibrio sp.]|nr:methyltransferase domain-containing protein [Propionivibrio sp.]
MRAATDCQRVRDSFERAAATYDQAAVVQRQVCDRLLDEFASSNRPFTHLLDAGCGTGYGARLLRARWPSVHYGCRFRTVHARYRNRDTDACFAADIEKLPFGDSSFDLWWSSLTIQWCDTDRVFSEAARVLRPKGRLALSTLGPDTFSGIAPGVFHR